MRPLNFIKFLRLLNFDIAKVSFVLDTQHGVFSILGTTITCVEMRK